MIEQLSFSNDITEALRRFDQLPQHPKLLLWLCAYVDEPMDTFVLNRLFDLLVQRALGEQNLPANQFRGMVLSLKKGGWFDGSFRCPPSLVFPLFLKSLRSYVLQGAKHQRTIQEFDRYQGPFHAVPAENASSGRFRVIRGKGNRTQPPPPSNNILMVLEEISSYPSMGSGLLKLLPTDGNVVFRRIMRDIRVALAQGDLLKLLQSRRSLQGVRLTNVAVPDISFPIPIALPSEFSEAFLAATSPSTRQIVHTEILRKSMWYPMAERDRVLDEIQQDNLFDSEGTVQMLGVLSFSSKLTCLMLMGRLSEAMAAKDSSGIKWPCHVGLADFLQGRPDKGRLLLESFLRETESMYVPWVDLFGCFLYFLQEIVRDETGKEGPRIARKIEKFTKMLSSVSIVEKTFIGFLMPLVPLPSFQAGNALKQLRESDTYGSATLEMFRLLCILYLEGALSPSERHSLEEIQKGFARNGYMWLALESAAMLLQAGSNEQAYRDLIEEMRLKEGIVPFVQQLPIDASWKKHVRLILEILRSVQSAGGQGAETAVSDRRIIWRLHIDKEGRPAGVLAVEQTRGKSGKWSAGKSISVKRLQSNETRKIMTDQDMAIAACVQPMDSYHRYRYSELWINPVRAVVAMIGHPHVYRLEDPAQHLELVRAEPEVVAKRKNGKVVLSLHPPATGNDVTLVQESPNRIRVVVFNQLFQRVGNLIGEVGIEIPATEKDVLSKTLASLSAVMTVHSSVPFDNDQLEQLAPQPVPIVQIAPDGPERFRLNVFVRPLGMGGPVLRAGKGAVTIVSEIDGKRLQAIRNLSEEKRLAAAVEERLLALDSAEGTAGEWVIANPEDCLQALADLRELQEQGSAVVEWPEGEKFKFSRPLSFDQVQLRMRAAMDWFEIEGELQIDEAHVIGMKQLIDLLAANPGRRFVQMEDGLFLSLTAALRKRLEELSAFTEKRGKKLLLHGLAAPAVEDILHPFQHVEVDSHWQDRLKRVEEAMRLEPAIPSTLKAALREYQKEGFRWMCRLAHLGCGACLADDMGLGKTVQAIAMLLSKAAEGPSLVVAPMSVCANWLVEVERFAPTLRVHTLHVADRKGLIEGLGPMDVLVTSYGLLHQEGEVLAVRRWSVVVLDEAQAIKNMTTKRYQAAVRLQGGFKLITTGTPVENHLGEFYTLFQFINPGLLGSKDRFNRRYVIPIEREHDKQARQRLRKLVKPFILRRLKSQVLEELPPKTDIVLRVALKPEEIALYEAMRQKAIDRIANMDGPIESRRFELLAEIMKLRQVCCHPKLIHPEFPDVGSKLESFGEIVSELLEGGHKALVFSQFLGHLALIRDYLDKAGIVYRYLDGKTPAKQRQQEIEAFQSGNGDLFLISLKAGGLGLNLTAADYVIHMDPWWNPAVEDQASDRAHRIGQSRSVTVYRLVAQGTIEEKIVKLHAEKRELAESLLEGTDTSARMGAEELLRLIQAEEA